MNDPFLVLLDGRRIPWKHLKKREKFKLKLRVFRCVCNHKLRYGTHTCSYCFRPTRPWNRWWFLPVVLALVGFLAWRYAFA
ncbi:hypothetical protein [Maliponia aquimaris]|nr:hypothetical protein [Maliponia aquimaris]